VIADKGSQMVGQKFIVFDNENVLAHG